MTAPASAHNHGDCELCDQIAEQCEDFRRKYHEAMEILTAWDKIDQADAVARLQQAETRLTERRGDD